MSPFLNIAVPASSDAEPSEPSEPLQQRARSNQPRVFAFTIRAAAEPETVPRLILPFAKRGLVPKRFSARAGSEPGWLTIWVEAELSDDAAANSIASNLRGILCVDAVLLEETRRLPRRRERSFGAFAAG